jgi:GT2 family glycosyltransferase
MVQIDEVIVAGERPARNAGARVVEDPCPARAANRAASTATGDVLIFCSQSASLPSTAGPRWVGELVAQSMRPEIGAVSGTVLDAEGRLRHGGVRVDLEGLAGPVSRDLDLELLSAAKTLNPGAASGELLAIQRQTFDRAGGFDAEHLPGSLFALDLAFRLEEAGLISVYTPVAQIQCRDSRSFPSPEEIEYMWSHWGSRINRLLDYERSPVDPDRPPLAPGGPDYAMFATGRSEVPA